MSSNNISEEPENNELLDSLNALVVIDKEMQEGLELLESMGPKDGIEEASRISELMSKLDMKLIKEEVIIERICEIFLRNADSLEEEAVLNDDSNLILIAHQYRELSEAIQRKLALLQEADEAGEEKSVKAVKNRRNFFSAMAMTLGATAVIGGSSRANAVESPVATLTIKGMYADMKTHYAIFIKELKGIVDLMNGLNTINQAFVNGISGLLQFEAEQDAKKIATHVTVGERISDSIKESLQVQNEIGSKAQAGTCSVDSLAAVEKTLKESVKKEVEFQEEEAINEGLTGEKGSGKKLAEKIIENIVVDGGGALSSTSVFDRPAASTQEAIEKQLLSVRNITIEPDNLIGGDLTKIAMTPAGRKYIAAKTKRIARRSVATNVVNKQAASNRTSAKSLEFLKKRFSEVGVLPAASGSSEAESLQSDGKMVAYAEALNKDLKKLVGDKGGVSLEDTIRFQVDAKNIASYFEFIRSTGFVSAPLLREMIDHSSLSLKLQHYAYEEQKKTNALLSILLLEKMDDPQSVENLNAMYKEVIN